MKHVSLLILFGLCTVSLTLSGCDDSADTSVAKNPFEGMENNHDDHDHDHHDHEDHPETYAEAVDQISAVTSSIKDAFAEDPSGEAAHHELHEIGELLEVAKKLLEEQDSLGDEAKAGAKESLDTLFNAYGDIDESMHTEDGKPNYSEVAEKIDAAVGVLKDSIK